MIKIIINHSPSNDQCTSSKHTNTTSAFRPHISNTPRNILQNKRFIKRKKTTINKKLVTKEHR